MEGRRRRAQGRPARARAAAAPLPRRQRAARAGLARLAPSGRSIVVGLGIVAVAVGAYFAARESSAFAIDRVEVSGAPRGVATSVRRSVRPLLGTSLLALDGGELVRRVESLPTVVSVRYDRGFPHTLRLGVVPETPVAVLHRGRQTWLLSARGRVVARIPPGTKSALARVWVPHAATVAVGAFVADDAGGAAARALALAARFPAAVATASLRRGDLVFKLRSGLELRLGAPTDIRLKLAIARQALRALPPDAAYVDVSVPGRPVAGPAAVADPNSQVSGGG
ncbi:MAG TPA: FtsQ-type POTRA domain-containing protein [Gaiellaceae bacterium]|nr:FtsQ-type POTRA domain-containing protein [Gaiellaceae bacterium]